MKTLGFIINPVAGMGGRVGLRGTDGMAEKAASLGAVPTAHQKAARALAEIKCPYQILAAPGAMGEDCARSLGMHPVVTDTNHPLKTTQAHTIAAAEKMLDAKAALILFAGGDGTARDIYKAVQDKIPVAPVPAGVKMHSPVFAKTPEKAGELAWHFLSGKIKLTCTREVLDIDEDLCRKGRIMTRLYGYLEVPRKRACLQNRKAGSPLTEQAVQNLIALYITDKMQKDMIYILGPGTTTRAVSRALGLDSTLMGVDIICNKKILCMDAAENDILKAIHSRPFKIIITPTGGQGCLLGRGNLQISPEIIQKAGKKNLIVIATPEKLAGLQGNPMIIDTGDRQTDHMLSGYMKIITGYNETRIYPVM